MMMMAAVETLTLATTYRRLPWKFQRDSATSDLGQVIVLARS